MSLIVDVFIWINRFIVNIISKIGYVGIIILMALESMITPLPSELILPFAGYLALKGVFNIWIVILCGAIGSLIGSLISYYIGFYGGERLVRKIGKYFLLEVEDLEWTESWFKKKGEKTIFISRFIPIVRHLISIPAGIGKMNLKKFMIYTFTGAFLWSAILTYAGYYLGKNWEYVHDKTIIIAIVVIILIGALIFYFILKRIMRKRKKSKEASKKISKKKK